MTIQRLPLVILLMFFLFIMVSSMPSQDGTSVGNVHSSWFQKFRRKWDTLMSSVDNRYPHVQRRPREEILHRKINEFISSLKYSPHKILRGIACDLSVFRGVCDHKKHETSGEFHSDDHSLLTKTTVSGIDEVRKSQRARPTHFGGLLISNLEIEALDKVRNLIFMLGKCIQNANDNVIYDENALGEDQRLVKSMKITSYDDVSEWLWSCTDIDIVRFLRRQSNDPKKAFAKLVAHAQWRISYPNGADHIVEDGYYKNNVILKEQLFWMDNLDRNGCPTAVVRALLHDGKHYDDDPQKFTNFLVYLLETSRKKLNVGSEKSACLLLDRFPLKSNDGIVENKESFDLSVIPNIISLLSKIVETMEDNYPEVFESITVTPASWFFQTCFRFTSKLFEKEIKDRFHLFTKTNAIVYLNDIFPDGELVRRLGVVNSDDRYNTEDDQSSEYDSDESREEDSLVGSVWLSSLIAMLVMEISMYCIWRSKEYVSCFCMPIIGSRQAVGVGTSGPGGRKFRRVRSRDIMTF